MISKAIRYGKEHSILLVFAFFAAYLTLGLLVFDDYGVSTDEIFQNDKASLNLDYISGKSDALLQYPDRHYGAVLAVPLYMVGKALGDPRSDYLFRHLVTFLIFYASAMVFYLTARRLKLSKIASLLGTAMYIFHPHIFSHSFYNIKDSPFLALYMLSIFTLLRLAEKPSIKLAILHGFISGMLVVFRLPGLLMWAITFIVWAWMFLRQPNKWKKLILVGAVYAFSAILTLFIFIPAMWHDPLGEARAFFSMDLFEWEGKELFMGKFLSPPQFPRYYLPMYMIVTTPLVFTVFLGIGTLFALRDLILHRELFSKSANPKIILLLSLFLPIVYIMAARPIIYNGWRHMFFVYAPFALLAAMGIDNLWRCVSLWNSIALRRSAQIAILMAIFIQTVWLSAFLTASHPFEHVYYNRLAGASLADAREQYSMDYWGLSYRRALEHLLKADDRALITVCGALNHEVRENLSILPKNKRERIRVVKCSDDPDYYLTNYYFKLDDNGKGGTLVDQITVTGARINGTYLLKDGFR